MDMLVFLVPIIVGIICVLYGIAFERVEEGSHLVFFWCALGLAFALPGVLACVGIWQRMPGLIQWIWAIVLVLFFVYEAVFFAFASRHFKDKGQPSLDYLVVLGSRVFEDGPCNSFARRLEAAKAYLADNPGTLCIACGGRGIDEPATEASVAAEYLQMRGIGRDRIIVEEASRNTAESLRNSMSITDAGKNRIGIATEGYHLFRTLAVARWLGMASPVGVSGGMPARFLVGYLVRESIALPKDALALRVLSHKGRGDGSGGGAGVF